MQLPHVSAEFAAQCDCWQKAHVISSAQDMPLKHPTVPGREASHDNPTFQLTGMLAMACRRHKPIEKASDVFILIGFYCYAI